MNYETLATLTFKLTIISGLIFLLFIIPVRYFLRKKALNKIKQQLQENEYIVYEAKFDNIIEFIFPFGVGGFFGGFILPFFLYEYIQNISMVNNINLPYFIVAEVILIAVILLFSACKDVITTTQFNRTWAFKFLEKYTLKLSFLIQEINSIELHKDFSITSIDIHTENNKNYRLIGYKNLPEIKNIIENLV